MADEATLTSAAPPTEAPQSAPVATPQTDPTPAQAESKSVVASLSDEIDGLWSRLEGKPQGEPEPAAPTPQAETPKPEPKAETPAEQPAPAVDEAEYERRARAKIEAEAAAQREAEERIARQAEYEQRVAAYTGSQADYDAVERALLAAATTSDYSLLDALDVTLPNGQKVSELKAGQKGLTLEEAGSVLQAWKTNRAYQDTVGDAKVKRVLDYWNQEVLSTLQHPDVDAASVIKHESPAQQMRAVIESVTAKVTQRIEAPLRAELKARDEKIAAQEQRIQSLLNERGNLSTQARAAAAASPDRPGLPAGAPRDLPRTPEEIRNMSADDFFKSGVHERLLRAIPSGVGGRRRAG